MGEHQTSRVGPYRIDSYYDNNGKGHVVTRLDPNKAKDLPRDPHTHEVIGTDHSDITNKDGTKTDKVIKNDCFWLQD